MMMIEEDVVVDGTPRAVQSASNPTIDAGWIRSMLERWKSNTLPVTGTGRLTGEEEFAICGRQ